MFQHFVGPSIVPRVGRVMKNRQALAEHFAACGLMVGAEIGVGNGAYSQQLCAAGLTVYGVDTWASWRRQSYPVALALLAAEIQAGRFLVMKQSSLDAAATFAPGSLDWVFIDADHRYAAVKGDIAAWAPKVRAGGIVAGHDYCRLKRSAQDGVIRAVNEAVAERGVTLQVTEWDWTNPSRDSRQPSWWFVVGSQGSA